MPDGGVNKYFLFSMLEYPHNNPWANVAPGVIYF